MKTVAELKNELEQITKKLNDAQNRAGQLQNNVYSFIDKRTPENRREFLDACDKKAEVENEIALLKRIKSVLQNNIRVALYSEIMPKIIEVLKKYEGKSAGEKTSQKLRAELKEATGYNVYISRKTISVYGEGLELELYASYNVNGADTRFIGADNKYIANKNTYIYDNYYVENIENFLAEQQKKLDVVSEYAKKAKEILQEVNAYNVGFKSIYLKDFAYTDNIVYGKE